VFPVEARILRSRKNRPGRCLRRVDQHVHRMDALRGSPGFNFIVDATSSIPASPSSQCLGAGVHRIGALSARMVISDNDILHAVATAGLGIALLLRFAARKIYVPDDSSACWATGTLRRRRFT
jgi:hypothetical protein